MSPRDRKGLVTIGILILFLALAPRIFAQVDQATGRGGGQGGGQAAGQGKAVPRPPAPAPPSPAVRGHVFVGGYFYNPVYGPYPWWPHAWYPYPYWPVFDYRAQVRLQVTPRDAAVYVDGFYAGLVDDFDGFFQSLPLPPGGHEIVVYLEGFGTLSRRVYLGPGTSFRIKAAMEELPPGVKSAPPPVAPPVPAPPEGSYRQPRALPPAPVPAPTRPPVYAEGYGTLQLRVQPTGAEVTIDEEPWTSADGQHFIIELAAGRHHIEVWLEGYQRYVTVVEIRKGEPFRLNVSLSKGGGS